MSLPSLAITVATPADREIVLDILRSASAARALCGVTIWGEDFPDVVGGLASGEIYLARMGGQPVGTFALRWSDDAVWGPGDGDSGYLHRLAIRPEAAGQSLGTQLISAAADLTRERGRRWLRLDCDRDNSRLRAYYESHGFSHAGDITGVPRQTRPGYRSVSRYQLDLSNARRQAGRAYS
jgi:protein-tyrosine phosphatase